MPDQVPLHATFDTVASLYDEVRPGYPDVIVDAVIERSGLPAKGRILEIGCGTGQITRPFARRGYAILALELGPSLAALAAEHLRPYPQVRVVPVAFETWPAEREAFDLVLAAQAFHWIDPAFGLARAAAVLKPQGALALVWHLDRSEHTDFYQATQPLYERFLPSDAQRAHVDPLEQRAMRYHAALRQSEAFARLTAMRHSWQRQYTGSQFLKLLQTFSNHQTLPEPAKTQFFQGMAAELARFGNVVTCHYETLLLVAHKADVTHQSGDQRDE
ncbi:MAG: class I SAM-dependent methyltransferase [Roseiflexaceae bacterium]